MTSPLSNLDFTRWEIYAMCFIPALINLCIFFYSSYLASKTRLNTYFSTFTILLAFWQMTEGFVHSSTTIESALFWNKAAVPFLLFAMPFGLLFVLSFTRWDKAMPYDFILTLLFLPSIFIFVLNEFGLGKYVVVASDYTYWNVTPEPSPFNFVLLGWLSLWALITIAILWIYYKTVKCNATEKKKALILAISFSIPVVFGIIAEVIFPLVLGFDDIPLTPPMLTFFSIGILLVITKFKMLDFSPKHQWENILLNTPVAILIVDNSGLIKYTNASFNKMVGYDFSELKDQMANDLLLNKDQTDFDNTFTESKEKMNGPYEEHLTTKSGQKIWVIVNGTPYYDQKGNVVGSIYFHANINDLKETKIALKKSESQLKEAQSIAHVGSWELSFDSKTSVWSEEACLIYEIPFAQREQSLESWLSLIHPEDVTSLLIEVESSIDLGKKFSHVHRIVCPSGVIKHIRSTGKVKFSKDKTPIGLIVVCHDITQQTITEEELRSINMELETFIYRASHDLRGPITSILGLINLGQIDVADKKALNYFKMIEGSVIKLDNALVSLVRAMQMSDQTGFDDLINFENIITETLRKYEYFPNFSNLKTSVSINQTAPFMSSHFIINTIIQNLIENAIKYQNTNSNNSFLNINISGGDKEIKMEVSDNGIGIDTDLQEKVFDMFYRGTNSSQGSGLGLYLVKKAIKQLNGNIELKSTKGKGTSFFITFKSNTAAVITTNKLVANL